MGAHVCGGLATCATAGRGAAVQHLEPLGGLTNLTTLDLSHATGITSLEPLRGMKVKVRGGNDALLAAMK